ncbi:hypothetical protein JW865_06005 [Candidatus Bathyarchaeota archaeon]|nr:hypothetical protein [Candidatus Bathyarchaeota archaeon]
MCGVTCDPLPISNAGVADLRRLLLRTLNDNQILILTSLTRTGSTLTRLLNHISEEQGIPLSTLKLNARILRELNLISYGSSFERKNAELKPLGKFVLKLIDDSKNTKIKLSD